MPDAVKPDYPEAVQFVGAAAGDWHPGRAGLKPTAVVIHCTDSDNVDGTVAWFHNPASHVSAHYVNTRVGAVFQFVREADTAYHAGNVLHPTWRLLVPNVNPNLYTIGIENVARSSEPWTDQMYFSLAALVASIAGRWGIPLDEDHIVLHREIFAFKTCPGQFDRGRLLAELRARPSLLEISQAPPPAPPAPPSAG